jgi:hypothetical protein
VLGRNPASCTIALFPRENLRNLSLALGGHFLQTAMSDVTTSTPASIHTLVIV